MKKFKILLILITVISFMNLKPADKLIMDKLINTIEVIKDSDLFKILNAIKNTSMDEKISVTGETISVVGTLFFLWHAIKSYLTYREMNIKNEKLRETSHGSLSKKHFSDRAKMNILRSILFISISLISKRLQKSELTLFDKIIGSISTVGSSAATLWLLINGIKYFFDYRAFRKEEQKKIADSADSLIDPTFRNLSLKDGSTIYKDFYYKSEAMRNFLLSIPAIFTTLASYRLLKRAL